MNSRINVFGFGNKLEPVFKPATKENLAKRKELGFGIVNIYTGTKATKDKVVVCPVCNMALFKFNSNTSGDDPIKAGQFDPVEGGYQPAACEEASCRFCKAPIIGVVQRIWIESDPV